MTDTTEATDKTPNPNGIYGHISLCEGMYKTDFCLNGGTCHSHRYLDSQVYTCECDSHFHGQRCEEKSLEGSYKGGMTVRNRRSERRSRDQLSRTCMFSVVSSLILCYISLVIVSSFSYYSYLVYFALTLSEFVFISQCFLFFIVDSLNPPKQMGRKGYPIQQRHHRFTSTSAVLP